MLLLFILLGTLVAGIGSVLLAALISPNASSRFAPDMLSFAAGALLSTACLHLLPEALSAGVQARTICIVLLAGFVLFLCWTTPSCGTTAITTTTRTIRTMTTPTAHKRRAPMQGCGRCWWATACTVLRTGC